MSESSQDIEDLETPRLDRGAEISRLLKVNNFLQTEIENLKDDLEGYMDANTHYVNENERLRAALDALDWNIDHD